ncbi:MAG: LemA family protein [Candidatus Parcubacteria bacterium]|nr:MAG: LemA family protein [Candidatus Parcubacteria bacterium]
MINSLFLIIFVLIIASGLFNIVEWQFNIVALAVSLFIWLVLIYNQLIRLREQVKESSSDIEIQLKRRADLIPNLIETVKGYAAHEKEVFEKVTEARSKILEAKTVKEGLEADNMLTSALKSLFAVAENYPDLKANQNFLHLQQELVDAEDKIQASRRFYNAVLREYEAYRQSFPNSVIANLFKFPSFEYFELNYEEKETAEKPPEVKF